MSEFAPVENGSAQEPPLEVYEPPARRWPIVLTLALLGGIGAGLYWLSTRPIGLPMAENTQAAASAPTLAPAQPALPPVDEAAAQASWRAAVKGLSSAPEWAAWTRQPGVLRRLISAVASVSEGASPRPLLGFLAPSAPFDVVENEATTVISPASFARYDPLIRVMESLDASAVAQAYGMLSPTIESLYRELAPPGRTFEATLSEALGRLTAVAVPTSELEVVEEGALYRFADADLEAKSPAEKHLLRMGPENMRRFQAKLRAFQNALAR